MPIQKKVTKQHWQNKQLFKLKPEHFEQLKTLEIKNN